MLFQGKQHVCLWGIVLREIVATQVFPGIMSEEKQGMEPVFLVQSVCKSKQPVVLLPKKSLLVGLPNRNQMESLFIYLFILVWSCFN